MEAWTFVAARRAAAGLAASAASMLVLVACGGGGADGGTETQAGSGAEKAGWGSSHDGDHRHGGWRVDLNVLSSPPQYVSGGDARVAVRAAPGLRDKLELWLNSRRLDVAFSETETGFEAVVTGLADGDNWLEVRQKGRAVLDRIKLTNHPITGPMFSGPQQQPFTCTTTQGAVGRQPLVESLTPPGHPVFDTLGNKLGYSRNCSIDTFVTYWYRSTANQWKPLPADGATPADLAQVALADGRTVDFVVRQERGTINRFLYSFAMLAPRGENPAQPDLGLWNRRLQYWFQGGVAIGHTQGTLHGGAMNADVLRTGTAIVHSSGNNTGTHYNLQVAGETAMMTKERFIERYGRPLYTYGLGGSGGAIQQYVLAQNQPGILDAALPVQSYPDMVTQTIHVGDCELLEHYMDATDRANPKWRVTKNRSFLVGMNAEEGFARVNDALAPLKQALGYSTAVGSTECIPGWRGLSPLAMNPWYGQAPNQQLYEPQSDIAAIRWTHYDDLRNIYGVDATGAARPTWDNVGVQYGLRSMKEGKITPQEFLDLNHRIGGWKHPSDMVQEGFPFFGTSQAEVTKALTQPGYFDPWSSRNMNLAPALGQPAPRTQGDPIAMRAAYTSGMVFRGRIPLPTIDHRQYMERELDMHNVHQSFAVRKRVLQAMGTSDHLVIWFTDTMPGVPRASNTFDAIAVMDEWMANIRANPRKSVAENRPARAVDSCFDVSGQLIYAGNDAWDGIIDDKPAGPCTKRFPIYATSRIVAGAPLEGGIYQCALKPVDEAVADGTYAPWMPNGQAVTMLKQVFPDGVCDYSRPDRARPWWWHFPHH